MDTTKVKNDHLIRGLFTVVKSIDETAILQSPTGHLYEEPHMITEDTDELFREFHPAMHQYTSRQVIHNVIRLKLTLTDTLGFIRRAGLFKWARQEQVMVEEDLFLTQNVKDAAFIIQRVAFADREIVKFEVHSD